jgi:protocatechuate 3,4-dioxygenase beta subunit
VTARRALAIGAGVALIVAAVVAWKVCAGGSDAGRAKSIVRTPPTAAPAERADPRAQPLASIAGTVTKVDGTPIAGARVCAIASRREQAPSLAREPRCATTDDKGTYAIPGLLAIRHQVAAMARPYAPASLEREVALRPGERTTGVDLVLRGAGVELTGAVVDLTGGPIAHAYVYTHASPPIETDDAGRFTLWVRRGGVEVHAMADGYTETAVQGSAPGEVVLSLTPESSIAGIVIDGGTGEPIAGAVVQVTGERAPPALGDITDADGRFRVDRIEPGRYLLAATSPGRFGASDGAVLVGLAQHVDGATLTLFPVARVEGRVMIAGQPPRPCAAPSGHLTSTRSFAQFPGHGGTDGTLRIDAVVPGTYQVSIRCEGAYTSLEYEGLVVGETDVTGLTWELAEATSIVRGRVLDARGAPVAGAEVRAYPRMDVTGPDGRYELTGLPSVPRWLDVVSSAGVEPAAGFEVDGGGTAGVVERDLVLEDGGRIEGLVVDTAGAPVEHVVIGATLEGDGAGFGCHEARAWSRHDGRFELAELCAGLHRITVDTRYGPVRVEATIDVRPAKTATARLVVEASTGTIRGTVRDAAGNPIADAYVTVAREQSQLRAIHLARWSTPRGVVTDVDGRFVIDALPDATFTLYAARRGGGEVVVEHIAVGATVDVRIQPTGSIEGTVRMRGGPARDLHVSIRESSTGPSRIERFYGTDGRYAMRDLPAGSYSIAAQTGGRRGARRIDLAEGQHAAGIDLDLDGGATIRGRVIDPLTRDPVAGVAVQIGGSDAYPHLLVMTDTAPPAVRTGADGRFQLDGIPAGTVVVEGDLNLADGSIMVRRTVTGGEVVDVGDVCLWRHGPDGRSGIAWNSSAGGSGVAVTAIEPDGPAARTALRVGDVITAINGIRIGGGDYYCAVALLGAPPGARLELRLARDETVMLTLAAAAP